MEQGKSGVRNTGWIISTGNATIAAQSPSFTVLESGGSVRDAMMST